MAEQNDQESLFTPFVVRTGNVAKELVSTASNYSIKASELDFNLLNVQTFISKTESGEDEEEVPIDELAILDDKSLMADPNVKVRQMYEIEIVLYDHNDPLDKLNLSIGANPSMSRVFATIKPGSFVKYYKDIRDDLKRLITKRKLRAHMLVGFWKGNADKELNGLVSKIRVNSPWKIEEKISIEVGCALEPVETIDDAVFMLYEKKAEENELARVDHNKRGFVKGVEKGDLLIQVIKAKKGEDGRSCRGEFIEAREPFVLFEGQSFNIGEKIEMTETETAIEYRAKESGYVTFENNTYDIKAEMEVTEISFKTTGSIEAGTNTDVSINVKEADAFKDAIGAGMEVEVSELNVDGNIGNNAKIRANKVNIEGQTHQSSYIQADIVKVNIHKGRIKGKEVEVTRLEQGIIEGEKVEVLQATGGKIVAKEVLIDTLSSHVNITASEKIEIKNLKGEENSFTISALLYAQDKAKLSSTEEHVTVQKRKIRNLKEEAEKKQKILDNNHDAIVEIKERLDHYKESGTKLPASFVSKYKEFQELQQNLANIRKEIRQNEDKLELILSGTKSLQGDIMSAKIINHSMYKGHNEIRFKLLEPELELYYVPKGTDSEHCFMLQYDEENEAYIIKGSGTIPAD